MGGDYDDVAPHLTANITCCCGLIRTAVDAVDAIDKLTGRECEVLVLLGVGMPNRLVARRLRISERTVKAHVKSIVDKLGVRSRLEAAIVAVLHHRLICRHDMIRSLSAPP